MRDESPERRLGGARVLRPLAVLLVSSLVALLLAEGGVRAFDPYGISYYRDVNRYFNGAIEIIPEAAHPEGRIFQQRPGVDLQLRTFGLRTNALGLRSTTVEDGFSPTREGEQLRILFLGDSVTLAWGVDYEDAWIHRLERAARGAAGEPVVCINAGHLQYNSIQEADLLEAFGDSLDVDLVVLTYVVNDIDDAWALYQDLQAAVARREESGSGSQPTLSERTLVWFRGLHGLLHFMGEREQAKDVGDLVVEEVRASAEYAEDWARSRSGLERMLSFCEERDLPFVVFDHSVPRILEVRAWCEESEVPWYDFTFTEQEWGRGITNSVADPHANALGNELLLAKALLALRGLGILASE